MMELQIVALTIEGGRLRILGGRAGLPAQKLESPSALDRSAERLLKSYLTADHLYLEQLYTFVFRGGRVVVAYLALVRNARLKPRGLTWQPAENQREVAAYGLKRLRNKITYTNLAFAFLPGRFTLSELQGVYEAIVGRALDKRNFRKKILSLDILAAEGEVRRGGRPARLYRFTGQPNSVLN